MSKSSGNNQFMPLIYSLIPIFLAPCALLLINMLNEDSDKIIIPFVNIEIRVWYIILELVALIIISIIFVFSEKLGNILQNTIFVFLLILIITLTYTLTGFFILQIVNLFLSSFTLTILISLVISSVISYLITIKLRKYIGIKFDMYFDIFHFVFFYVSTILVTVAFIHPIYQSEIGYLVFILAIPILNHSYIKLRDTINQYKEKL